MPPRSSLDDKLAAIRRLRGESITSANQPELKKFIGDRSNLVVAGAAAIAGEHTLVELAPELEAAFQRFLVDPLENDKLCRAKIAVVQALDKMEHQRLEIFQTASKYIQLEPVWGGSEDTAVPLRAAALVAIARIDGPDALPTLIDAMIDPARDVRIATAVALGVVGTEAAAYLLRLKARIGDRDSEVLSECLSSLLAIQFREHLPFVREFLDPRLPEACEAAALALGKSRSGEALDPLVDCWQVSRLTAVGQQVLLAIAMLRLPAALDFLIELLRSESEPSAFSALAALKIHSYDSRLCERIAALVEEKGNRKLQLKFEQDFSAGRR